MNEKWNVDVVGNAVQDYYWLYGWKYNINNKSFWEEITLEIWKETIYNKKGKTIEEWFQLLPEDVRKKALNNVSKENRKKIVKNLDSAINSFIRRDTLEWSDYWCDVNNRAERWEYTINEKKTKKETVVVKLSPKTIEKVEKWERGRLSEEKYEELRKYIEDGKQLVSSRVDKEEEIKQLQKELWVKKDELENNKKSFDKYKREEENRNKKAIEEWKKKQLEERTSLLKNPSSYIDKSVEKTIKWSIESRQPILLIWPPGCGKNTILEKLLTKYCPKQKTILISLSWDVTKDSLLWHYVLDGDKTVWQDWPLSNALKNGYNIVLDEINMCHPDILAVLNNLLQLKPDGSLWNIFIADNWWEEIVPHKDSRIYATANPVDGNSGTKELNQATLSRFLSLNITYLEKEDEIRLLSEKFPEEDFEVIKTLIRQVNEVRRQRREKNVTIDISTRHLIKTLSLLSAGLDYNFAITSWILNDCQFEEDRKIVENFITYV